MSTYDKYYNYIVKSVKHIFKNFFSDSSIQEVYQTQSSKKDPLVSVELDGSLFGEIIINIPVKTLDQLIKQMIPDVKPRSVKKHHEDVAGELANLITGTFANLLQNVKHDVRLSPPEFNIAPHKMRALYENINVSFTSSYGGFDVDLFYRENR